MAGESSGAAGPPSRDLARVGCLLLLLAVASMDFKGYRFGGSNHSLQVPHLKHLVEPSLYRGDPVLGSFDGYVTFFFHALAPVVRLWDVEPVYFALYALSHFATLAAIYALGLTLLRSPTAAFVACFLSTGQVPSLGAELSYWPRLTHAEVATPLLLWAFWLSLRGRTLAAFALAGLTVNVHGLYALYVGVMLGADTLLTRSRRRGLLAAAGAFLLPALPALLWAFARQDPVPPEQWPLWLQTLRERSALHAFPLNVPASVYGRYLTLLSLGMLAFFSRPKEARHLAFVHFAIAVGALCVGGLFFSEVVPVRRLLEAQLLRSTKWLTFFVIVLVAHLVTVAWEWRGLARLAAALCVLGLSLEQPAWVTVSLVLFVVARREVWSLPLSALAALALIVDVVTGASPVGERFGLAALANGVRDVFASPVVAVCLGLLLVMRASPSAPRTQRAMQLLVPALLLGGVLPYMYRQHRIAVAGEAWNEAQTWVRRHTARDSVVLTPPDREGFRVLSERAVVGEWKDGTQQFFSWAFTLEWRRRMEDLEVGKRAFEDLPPERLAELGRRYGASTLVFPAGSRPPFESLFENSEFAVYRLPGTAGSPP